MSVGCRFIEEYERNGIKLWAVTAQNEPIDGFAKNFTFNCMGFTPEQQRDFIKMDLVLRAKNIFLLLFRSVSYTKEK